MAIALRELESAVPHERAAADLRIVEKHPDKHGGFLVGKLISEIRGENRIEEIAKIAGKLAVYQEILPDPLNRSCMLNVARLIAQTNSSVIRY